MKFTHESCMRHTLAVILVTMALAAAPAAFGQAGPHRIDGRLMGRGGGYGNIRVRLIYQDGMRPAAETVSQSDGQFTFRNVIEGNYIVEVEATERFEAVTATVEVRAVLDEEGAIVRVVIPMTPKVQPALAGPVGGSIPADVDLDVPPGARTAYEEGVRAEKEGDRARAVSSYKSAVQSYPRYYSARMALGRELRRQRDFRAALDALEPLRTYAPKRSEPLVEIGIVQMALDHKKEAAEVLRDALAIDEQNWAAHLYLGYSLLDADDTAAEPHFWRALKINPKEAAEAHLALARLAHKYGYKKDALEQLDAYLAAVPDASNASEVRRLRAKIASETP